MRNRIFSNETHSGNALYSTQIYTLMWRQITTLIVLHRQCFRCGLNQVSRFTAPNNTSPSINQFDMNCRVLVFCMLIFATEKYTREKKTCSLIIIMYKCTTRNSFFYSILSRIWHVRQAKLHCFWGRALYRDVE